jgi:hypothetical protein
VVDVRMAQYHRVNLSGVEWKVAIALDRFTPATLKQPAFQQELSAIGLQQVGRASGRAGGSEKVDAHGRKTEFNLDKVEGKSPQKCGKAMVALPGS